MFGRKVNIQKFSSLLSNYLLNFEYRTRWINSSKSNAAFYRGEFRIEIIGIRWLLSRILPLDGSMPHIRVLERTHARMSSSTHYSRDTNEFLSNTRNYVSQHEVPQKTVDTAKMYYQNKLQIIITALLAIRILHKHSIKAPIYYWFPLTHFLWECLRKLHGRNQFKISFNYSCIRPSTHPRWCSKTPLYTIL